MKTKYNKIQIVLYSLSLLMGLSGLTSCEHELLSQTNPNALTGADYWKTNDNFNMATNSMYGALQLNAVRGRESCWMWLRGDLAGTESWYYRGFTNFEFSGATSQVEERWSEYYIGVFRANQILYYLEQDNDLTDAEKISLEAQARCMRGLEYFWLGSAFNQAVIHKTLPKSVADMNKDLSPIDSVYNFALQDLEYAQANLPKSWNEVNQGRFTWGSATALMGKIHLYSKQYDEAAVCFKQIIDSGLYGLVDNFMDNFTTAHEFNKESIFEIVFSDNYKEGNSGNVQDEVNGSEGTSLAANLATLPAGGYNSTLPTYWYIDLMQNADVIDTTSAINDGFTHSQRSYATIVSKQSDGDYYQSPLLTETQADGTVLKTKTPFTNGQAAYVRKWLEWKTKSGEDPSTSARSGVNWREIRYADILLMYAECLLQQDNVQEAITYIDVVRKRAGVITLAEYMGNHNGQIPQLDTSLFFNQLMDYPYVDASKENVMHHLQMVERPMELGYEGKRWNDLVRWGIVDQVFTARRADEQKLCKMLTGSENEVTPLPGYGESYAPLYLGKIRTDFLIKTGNYLSSYSYLPVPSIELQLNKVLYHPEENK